MNSRRHSNSFFAGCLRLLVGTAALLLTLPSAWAQDATDPPDAESPIDASTPDTAPPETGAVDDDTKKKKVTDEDSEEALEGDGPVEGAAPGAPEAEQDETPPG